MLISGDTASLLSDAPDLARWQRVASLADVLQASTALCWCGERRRGHPKCAGCGVLVGPKHAEQTLRQGLCAGCYEDASRKPVRRARSQPVRKSD